MSGFEVQRRQCATCIYRRDSPLDLAKLEADAADPVCDGFFKSFRVCHHSDTACCRGFWDRHKDVFTLGQIAQRLKMVQFVDHDTAGRTDGVQADEGAAQGARRPPRRAARR